MGVRGWLVVVALLAVLSGVGAVFVIQNSARTTQLSFDVGFAAWELERPVSVIALAGGAFGGGFLLAAALFGPRAWSNGRRARELEQQIALSTAFQGGSTTDRQNDWR